MSDMHQGHEEDNSINVKVAIFFVAVIVGIFFLGVIN